MNDRGELDTRELIRLSRAGDPADLSVLMDRYRPYLKLLARLRQNPRLRSKVDDSDLVQEVSLQAIRDFPKFIGETEAQFAAWLRTKMAGVAAQQVRHFTTRARDVHLEKSLVQHFDRSSAQLCVAVAGDETPSKLAEHRERAVLVAMAMDELPEHYREAIILRDFEGLDLEQIAERMNRSRDSVRKIWARAVVMMKRSLKDKL